MEIFMADYFIKHSGTLQHYFHQANYGLCMQARLRGIWHAQKTIYLGADNAFSVLSDGGENVHIVCTSRENELVYLRLFKNDRHSCVLTRIKDELRIFDIKLFEGQAGLNLLFAAEYRGKNILIHCPLGDNALPDSLDALGAPDFFVFRQRVYYTNSGGALGYRDLRDGKADMFHTLLSDACEPYLLTHNGRDMIVCRSGNTIYFQNRPICEEEGAKSPILVSGGKRLYLMWQNGDFVRYRELSEGEHTRGSTMQFVSPGKKINKYYTVNNGCLYCYFGFASGSDFHMYGTENMP